MQMQKIHKRMLAMLVLWSVVGISILPQTFVAGDGIRPASLQYSSDQMEREAIKIYEKIGDVTFTHATDTLTYHIYFGLAFPTINGSRRIAAYVYLLSDANYITNAEVHLSFVLDIQYNGKNLTRSGIISDSTSILQWGNELYSFEMLGETFSDGEFPITMDVDLTYTLSSTDLPTLSKSDSYTTSRYFFSPVIELWVFIVIICACAGAAVVVIIVVVIVHKKKATAGAVPPTSEMVNPASAVIN